QVRLVRTKSIHHFCKREARKWRSQVDVDEFENRFEESFDQGVNLIECREAHLNVELCKLRLAIGAQIFVTKTVCDLEVLIQAANHAQLFEELWRLWQCKKLSRENARRDDVIARAFRSRLDQDRRFDLVEPVARHVTP